MSTEQMQQRVKELYDYDAIIAKSPDPATVEWVFGYGSIIFKQGFDSRACVHGYVYNWKRVFYQQSTDHRGTPEAPGRTVTLIASAGSQTWGIAYKLPEGLEERRSALQELEWREKQYDIKEFVNVYGADGTALVTGALTYIGGSAPEKNLNWAGEASQEEIAAQIAAARGPSGDNCDYLYGIASGLRDMGAEDEHVFDLEKRVRLLRQASN